jgi:hypothetical protein
MSPAQVDTSPESMMKAQIALYPKSSHVKKPPLQLGQLVRLSRIHETFEKDSYKYTLALWRISKVIIRTPRDIYEVSDLNNEPVTGRFYRDELLPVFSDTLDE